MTNGSSILPWILLCILILGGMNGTGVVGASPAASAPENATSDYAEPGWMPPPRPSGAGISQLEYITMWGGAAGKPWVIEFDLKNESQAYWYARTVTEPYTYWGYTDTAKKWNSRALGSWSATGVNKSKFPTTASLAEGDYVKDAHLTTPVVSQRVIVHKEQSATHYVSQSGSVKSVMDYRVETPRDTTTNVSGFFGLERRTSWEVKDHRITDCRFDVAGGPAGPSRVRTCSQEALSGTFSGLTPGESYVLQPSAIVKVTVEETTEEHVCTERRRIPTTTTTTTTSTPTTTHNPNIPTSDSDTRTGFVQQLLSRIFTPDTPAPDLREEGGTRYGECIESEWRETTTKEYSETVTISDSIPVHVMDQDATFYYRQNSETGEANVEAVLPAFYTRIDLFQDVTLRGPWKRFTARDPAWDELKHTTRNTSSDESEPFTPVQTHAYPYSSGLTATTENDGYVFNTRGDTVITQEDKLGPATLPNHVDLHAPDSATVPRRIQIHLPGSTATPLDTRTEFTERQPQIQQAWTTIRADWENTGALVQSNLTAQTPSRDDNITIRFHLEELESGDPIHTAQLPDTAIEVITQEGARTINTNASGDAIITLTPEEAGNAVNGKLVSQTSLHSTGPLYTTDSARVSTTPTTWYLERTSSDLVKYLIHLALVFGFGILIPLWITAHGVGVDLLRGLKQ